MTGPSPGVTATPVASGKQSKVGNMYLTLVFRVTAIKGITLEQQECQTDTHRKGSIYKTFNDLSGFLKIILIIYNNV